MSRPKRKTRDSNDPLKELDALMWRYAPVLPALLEGKPLTPEAMAEHERRKAKARKGVKR